MQLGIQIIWRHSYLYNHSEIQSTTLSPIKFIVHSSQQYLLILSMVWVIYFPKQYYLIRKLNSLLPIFAIMHAAVCLQGRQTQTRWRSLLKLGESQLTAVIDGRSVSFQIERGEIQNSLPTHILILLLVVTGLVQLVWWHWMKRITVGRNLLKFLTRRGTRSQILPACVRWQGRHEANDNADSLAIQKGFILE